MKPPFAPVHPWRLREACGLYFGTDARGMAALLPASAALVYDERDSHADKTRFAEILTGGRFTVENIQP